MDFNHILTPLALTQYDYAIELDHNLIKPLKELGFKATGFQHIQYRDKGYGHIILTFENTREERPIDMGNMIDTLLRINQVQSQPVPLKQLCNDTLFIFITYFD